MNESRAYCLGIVLGIRPSPSGYSIEDSFEQLAKESARRFGLGFIWIVHGGSQTPNKIGVVFRGPEGDLDGRMIGCLRSMLRALNVRSAIRRHPTGEWQKVSNDHEDASGERFEIENDLRALVSYLQQFRSGINVDLNSSHFEVVPSLYCEPGWLERWRRSVIARREPRI